MLKEITFGEFVTVKRKQMGLTLRELADLISLAPTYLCNIENGKRPAPAGEIQKKLVRVFELDDDERRVFFNLAAKTKRKGTLPFDILDYITRDNDVSKFLRAAKKNNLSGADLLELLKR